MAARRSSGRNDMRCAKCGRRVGFYLDVSGPYLSHVWPVAMHRAALSRIPEHPKED